MPLAAAYDAGLNPGHDTLRLGTEKRDKPFLQEKGRQRKHLKTLKLDVHLKHLNSQFIKNFQYYNAITKFCVIINIILYAACNIM